MNEERKKKERDEESRNSEEKNFEIDFFCNHNFFFFRVPLLKKCPSGLKVDGNF